MTRWHKLIAALWVLGQLLACAPVTRVILLPESAGKRSAVEVKTASGAQVLDAPYQTALVDKNGQVVLTTTDPLVVMDRYGAIMTQLPAPDEPFLLYFEAGGAQLTEQSQALLPTILARARARQGGEIIVIGHTDSVGTVQANDALSLQRAGGIRQWFVSQGFKPELIDAVGRGERAPLVPTADEVAEPKNRRAEIVVR